MANSIKPNDILWSRNGDPILVENINPQTGEVYTNNNFKKIQNQAKNGIKNGLNPIEREQYQSTLANVTSPDKKQEIINLFEKIKKLRGSNTDGKVLKYLENELQFRILRDNYKPDDYGIPKTSLEI